MEMEGHELTNRVLVNGHLVGYLPSQTWADMWMSAALPVPAELLRPGHNELTVEVGQAIPDCQAPGNAWDELLFRRVRLVRAEPARSPGASSASAASAVSRPVTITVVFDNNAYRHGLETAWGFACVVQNGDGFILFDTGGDGRMLLANMAALGLDPNDLDAVVLSHNHSDHTGGLEAVLNANPDMTVYVPQAFPAAFKSRIRARAKQVVEVSDPLDIQPGVWSTGQMGSAIVEQALVVQTGSDLTVITGCAHPGIVEIVKKAREVGGGEIGLVMGGLHLSDASASTLRSVVSSLGELGVQRIAPCHCTGESAGALLATAFGERYETCGVGLVLHEGE
jgi:7,8-dihydropterin-6-yl-methyl-4-(beta-D-ribofuranosyl)aminobenzene 5'-phosphate synthase